MNAQTIPAPSAADSILQQVMQRLGSAPSAQVFATHFLRRISADDLAARSVDDWTGMIRGMLDFVRVRKPGVPNVRVFNPARESDGYETTHTVVDIMTDDMSFLVDSVGIAIDQAGLGVHVVIHPVYGVERDAGGHVLRLAAEGSGGKSESLMHFEIDRMAEPSERAQLEKSIRNVLEDVAQCYDDWASMRQTMLSIADDMGKQKLPISAEGVAEAQEFLRWAAADHFTFLGYREYAVANVGGEEVLQAVEGSGLGILRGIERSLAPRSLKSLAARDLPQSGALDAIILTKTNARARVHRPGYMDYIGVLKFNDAGVPIAEQRFLGLFTSGAYTRRPWEVPLVRQKYEAVMTRSGLRRDSHSGKNLRHILETLPRDELFQSSEDDLLAAATGILQLQGRARSRLFVRRDTYGRFFSCLVFIPRDRFTADIRDRIEDLLKREFHGEGVDSSIQLGESPLARLHLVVRPKPGEKPHYDVADLENKISQIVRNWHDELRDTLVARLGEEKGIKLANRYGKALPAGYIEEVSAHVAAADVESAATLKDENDIHLQLYRSRKMGDRLRFKLFRYGVPITLSEALPMLENMGLKILSEHPYEMKLGDATTIVIQDFEVQPAVRCDFDIEQLKDSFQTSFERIWRGQAENDGFNRLILGANMEWRQVAVLRGIAKYLLQTGVPFSQSYMEETLNRYPLIAGLLVELFEAKFDPNRETGKTVIEGARKRLRRELETLLSEDVAKSHSGFVDNLVNARGEPRETQGQAIVGAIKVLLDRVASLDEDRILRAFLGVIGAMLRTSFYQTPGGSPREYISFKFDPAKVPDLPKPRPYREIFVYAPRVEGVHLRFGPVARGGLRWSDRREDFRTEVLGLVKAQMVKNTVIVPVGSKGGFFVKRPPAGGDRDAQLAEGVACYRLFINGLLDITDNLVEGRIAPPQNCLRYDQDDPYLVVAADKGTATFSDIANAVSAEHGFWLGDAFASGGSIGYDHKAMGITAKGAWESVKRHFRAMGRDCQTEDFTCVGIGDMSGDVFGNGMLLSRHIKLLAAFDHRHILLDPNPDAEKSFVERERMFKLPRSSWEDYDKKLISAGGGLYPRNAKSIKLTPQVRAALDIDESIEQMTPAELMSAILKSPVDLLWNGGIGTYVKASSETNADVGDRANNALRVNGGELRCKTVGEGGNLGFTQRGRIEAAFAGVLLNTDFIDNSAGVDTSDHEVNIKILLNDAVQRGELTEAKRNALLARMTDEVGELVLNDNYRQNQTISLMERMSLSRMGSKQHFIRTLEKQGLLDRAIEFLPSDAEIADRKSHGKGLTRPELSILLSYAKIVIFQQLLASDVPEDKFLSAELVRYFPQPLREKYGDHMQRHRLRREIIATVVTNSIVNRMGATFMLRMQEDTGRTPGEVAKAFTITRETLDVRALWMQIDALDGKVPESVQIDALQVIWSMQRSFTRWLLARPGAIPDIATAVERYHDGFKDIRAGQGILPDSQRPAYVASLRDWKEKGVSNELAGQLAALPYLESCCDIIELARERKLKVIDVAKVYFRLGDALSLPWLATQIDALKVDGRWHAVARGVLRDELSAQQRTLVGQVLQTAGNSPDAKVKAWIERDDQSLRFTLSMLNELAAQKTLDYPTASVAVQRLSQLVSRG